MIHLAHAAVTEGTNGPGRRFTVWVQGCDRGCPGCFNPGLQSRVARTRLSPEELAERAAAAGPLDGVTLSGGEPFDQAADLAAFLDVLRERPGGGALGVIAFTGYLREELQVGPSAWRSLLSRADLLVDGPYRQEMAAALPLRGSANQRLIALSTFGEELVRSLHEAPPPNFGVTIADDGEVILTGFPPPEAVLTLRGTLGH